MARKAAKKSNDLSNKTVLAVLIIVILVSVVSLGSYLSALDNATPTIQDQSEATVKLKVLDPPSDEPKVTVSGQGTVGLNVEDQ